MENINSKDKRARRKMIIAQKCSKKMRGVSDQNCTPDTKSGQVHLPSPVIVGGNILTDTFVGNINASGTIGGTGFLNENYNMHFTDYATARARRKNIIAQKFGANRNTTIDQNSSTSTPLSSIQDTPRVIFARNPLSEVQDGNVRTNSCLSGTSTVPPIDCEAAITREINIEPKNPVSISRAIRDENTSPGAPLIGAHFTPSVSVDRTPLSELNIGNTTVSSSICKVSSRAFVSGNLNVHFSESERAWQNYAIARARRKNIIAGKSFSNITIVTDHNIRPDIQGTKADCYTNTSKLERRRRASENDNPSILLDATLENSSNINDHTSTTPQENIGSSVPSTCTPFSEVLNPLSSAVCHKRAFQPNHVMQSIGCTRLNFDDHLDSDSEGPEDCSSDRTTDRHTEHIGTELYDMAETESCLDLGQPTLCCYYCKAYLWLDELPDNSRRALDEGFYFCCMKGNVQLPFLKKPPELLFNLSNGIDHRSNHFNENIRAYNSMFSFTSIGGKIEGSINDGGGPPQFILSGQNFHRIGSLIPERGCKPKFAQLYIYDTNNELVNRMDHFRPSKDSHFLDYSLVEDLTKMVDEYNEYAKSYRRARDYAEQHPDQNFSLRLIRNRNNDARTHNLPSCNEVAALIVGDDTHLEEGRDIVVQKVSGSLKRLHETHTAFIPLQYPLLFPYGEDGYQENIQIRDFGDESASRMRTRISLREWILFRIQERIVEFGNVVNSRRLFQQFVVDTYTMIESQRLSYIRANQKEIRCDILNGLQDAVTRGETDPSLVGKRVVLPNSFTGGMRYMFNNCQDAMAVCKRFGYPDLFITITCNSNWKEIQEFVSVRRLQPSDRPDIVCRVFKMKLDQMMKDFKKKQIFGKVDAFTYTVEFQKRGLPHAHILLWLSGANKLKTGKDIDKFISAELPDPTLYPGLSAAVTNYMIHGPCGASNPRAPCMKDRKCSKFFPKSFQASTTIDDDGYPKYTRRDSGIFIEKRGTKIDNRSVVPYNPHLLMRYRGHVNVEYCNKSNSIKYLFKYVNKGPDRATLEISSDAQNKDVHKVVDEIKQYYDCRYVSPCEAVWRIFSFDIHHRWPPVQRLMFHLPNQQRVYFNDVEEIDTVVRRNGEVDTMFLSWFEANKKFTQGRDLTYAEFPSKFVYSRKEKKWQPRKKGQSIGRLNYIPPGVGELYYMRILLTVQRGCIGYDCLRKVNGVTYNSFQEACYAMGLLADDKEFIDAITEASVLASGHQLRRLFVSLLAMNTMTNPAVVWNSTWRLLSDGIVYDRRRELNIQGLQIRDDELKNLCLIEIEKLLTSNGRSLRDYTSIPFPLISDMIDYQNKLIVDELSYDRDEMARTHSSLMDQLTEEQRHVYNEIMAAVVSGCGGFFFLDGYGGTGKTFVWNTLSAGFRAQGMIVLNVASSGIASLLLPRGRTAHSTFSIPLAINDDSTCNINQGSPRAKLLLHTKLIIWDEAPMMNRFCFEAFDRTMRDIMASQNKDNLHKPFGGKVVVLGGDFRQILPVIRKGSRRDIVGSAINSSRIWSSCKVLKLTKNMRLRVSSLNSDVEEIRQFADWILRVGDGDRNANENGESDIEIPEDLLIQQCSDPLKALVEFAYPDLLKNMNMSHYFQERGILAPTLESVEQINDFVISLMPGDVKEYFSSDTVCRSDENDEVQGEWFTTEFLNEIKCSGIPNHRLRLKVGVPVMLMRNIDQAAGLCNGTRLMVNELGKNVIGATVLTGTNVGDKILVPRMDLVPTDAGLPFKFQRRQFPLCLCFAMTINKSQGQSLSHVGIFLPRPVFTHGQLYVALSRVKSKKGLKILILDDEQKVCSSTKNVVYREVFENV